MKESKNPSHPIDKVIDPTFQKRLREVVSLYPMPALSFAQGTVDEKGATLAAFIGNLATVRNYNFPGTCIDVGANIGAFSFVAAHHFNRVIAFEPVLRSCETFGEHIKRHGLVNISVYNLAVGKADNETVEIYVPNDEEYSGDASNHWEVDRGGKGGYVEERQTISLETILEIVGPTAEHGFLYLKVDCEGAEYDFLLDKDLSFIDALAIEFHGDFDNQKKLARHLDKSFIILQACPDLSTFFAVRKVVNKVYPNTRSLCLWKPGDTIMHPYEPLPNTGFLSAIEAKEAKLNVT